MLLTTGELARVFGGLLWNAHAFEVVHAPVGRFLANVVNTGSGTSVSVLTDLTSFPQPTGNVAVLPGDTYNFQYWFRDVGSTSNFSDALSVTFQ